MSLELILGPMYSGKSTELIRRTRRYAIKYGYNGVLCIRYQGDNRYSHSDISTHDQTTITALKCEKIQDLGDQWQSYSVIAIDEGQFFSDIIPFTLAAIDSNIKVIISGLDGDFQKNPFKYNLLDLIPHADQVTKLTAICFVCGQDAPFTRRMTNQTEQTIIGGQETYKAACRKCHDLSLYQLEQKINGLKLKNMPSYIGPFPSQ